MIIPRATRFSTATAMLTAFVFVAPAAFAQETPQDEKAREAAESEDIVIQATRSGRRVGDEPIRVEVIDAEELAEKIMMVPGC